MIEKKIPGASADATTNYRDVLHTFANGTIPNDSNGIITWVQIPFEPEFLSLTARVSISSGIWLFRMFILIHVYDYLSVKFSIASKVKETLYNFQS